MSYLLVFVYTHGLAIHVDTVHCSVFIKNRLPIKKDRVFSFLVCFFFFQKQIRLFTYCLTCIYYYASTSTIGHSFRLLRIEEPHNAYIPFVLCYWPVEQTIRYNNNSQVSKFCQVFSKWWKLESTLYVLKTEFCLISCEWKICHQALRVRSLNAKNVDMIFCYLLLF